ncbi:MAG: pimelyl-ACP methyl ester esterase BioV [Campylobacterota bacterium]|nr:pimelyl-ACP methyl ester esterase BioV [Campylobacterota bacterium]
MKFYSGFSLKNESNFFDDYIKKSQYCICGFSYGAIKAYEYVKKQLENGNRVDSLQLFSPAFFQNKTPQFKKMQLRAYKKNQEVYLKQFINSCFSPYKQQIIEHNYNNTIDELNELLNYEWIILELKELLNQGVNIEVYLGGKDKIIDTMDAKDFFKEIATITYIKNANHFLQINN